jgi:hypothetical protein
MGSRYMLKVDGLELGNVGKGEIDRSYILGLRMIVSY